MWGACWPVVRAVGLARSWPALPIQWAAVSEAAAGPVRRALAGRPVMVLPNAVDTALWAPAGRATRRLRGQSRSLRGHDRRCPADGSAQEATASAHDAAARPSPGAGPHPDPRRTRRRRPSAGHASSADRRGRHDTWVEAPGPLSHTALRDLYRTSESSSHRPPWSRSGSPPWRPAAQDLPWRAGPAPDWPTSSTTESKACWPTTTSRWPGSSPSCARTEDCSTASGRTTRRSDLRSTGRTPCGGPTTRMPPRPNCIRPQGSRRSGSAQWARPRGGTSRDKWP